MMSMRTLTEITFIHSFIHSFTDKIDKRVNGMQWALILPPDDDDDDDVSTVFSPT